MLVELIQRTYYTVCKQYSTDKPPGVHHKMDPKSFQSSKSNKLINFCQMSCRIDPSLEETLCDIDEFIQSELGFASPITTEPLPAAELHELSSFPQTQESSNGSQLSNTLGEYRFLKSVYGAGSC